MLTSDEYLALLEQRRQEHYAEHGQPRPGYPALLEWFVRDGDEELFTPPTDPERPTPKPRRYRPATYWRDRLARIEARMAAINGVARHDTTDPAAHGGIGIRQTARQQRKYGERIDRAAEQYVRLERDRAHARRMLTAAEKRSTS